MLFFFFLVGFINIVAAYMNLISIFKPSAYHKATVPVANILVFGIDAVYFDDLWFYIILVLANITWLVVRLRVQYKHDQKN